MQRKQLPRASSSRHRDNARVSVVQLVRTRRQKRRSCRFCYGLRCPWGEAPRSAAERPGPNGRSDLPCLLDRTAGRAALSSRSSGRRGKAEAVQRLVRSTQSPDLPRSAVQIRHYPRPPRLPPQIEQQSSDPPSQRQKSTQATFRQPDLHACCTRARLPRPGLEAQSASRIGRAAP